MKKNNKRGILVSAGALVTAAALALGGSAVAYAAPVDSMPDDSAVIITKLEQPDAAGNPASGELQNVDAYSVIQDVRFEAYPVPVTDDETPANALVAGTNDWQEAVAGISIQDAQGLIGASPTAYRTGLTDVNGQIIWDTDVASANGGQGDNLDRGLYLIRETETPEGVVPSGDFLLAVPLTNPTALDQWLDTIYIYPKNRTLDGKKTVVNVDDYTVGSTVTWTIDVSNPSVRDQTTGEFIPTDLFQVLDTIEDEYLTATAADINVAVPLGLIVEDDYTVTLVPGASDNDIDEGFTQIQITFTAEGREKLADQMNTNDEAQSEDVVSNVVITIDTVVNKVGVIENSAQFYSSTSQTDPKPVPPTSVKYGSISLEKTSTATDVSLAGAEFRVYLSELAALAANEDNDWGGEYNADTNPNGYLVPADGPLDADGATGIYITDNNGAATIGGLRYSNFADGQEILDEADYLTYWLVETKALDEHQLLGEPVSFHITAQQADLDPIAITNAKDGGFELPLTGGMGTAFLTIGGLAILAVVLLVARSRRNDEVVAE